MSTKHSPGPWVIQDNAAHGVHIYSEGGMFGGGKHVARVSNSAGVDMLANARLLAAAPAMADALWKIAQMADAPCMCPEPSFGDGYDMAAGSAAQTALEALAAAGILEG